MQSNMTGIDSTGLVIRSRRLLHRRATADKPQTTKLDHVAAVLHQIEKKQKPRDIERTLDQLHVDFTGGKMTGRFLNESGIDAEEMRVLDIGAGHLARDVLPSRFFSGLKDLALLDETGGKLATMVWSKFAGRRHQKVRMVRTVEMGLPEGATRVIRSCHSQSYAPYSNLRFAQDLLEHTAEFADLPVLDWALSDTTMRLRFLCIDAPLLVLRQWDNGALLNEPVPMIEAWNSEVGCRRIGIRGGMWRLSCTNGMGHWDSCAEYSWIHRGDPQRIQDGLQSAFTSVLTMANGVVDAYKDALDVAIDDAYAWMQAELERQGATDVFKGRAAKALTHPTTTPGGSLASVVDAITLAAQDERDFVQQDKAEQMGAQVLRTGLARALKSGDNTITMEA